MKNFILILLVIIVSCKTLRKHKTEKLPYRPLISFDKDTASYIKYNFIERKQAYLNKNINVLIEDTEVPVKYYTDGGSAKYVDSIPYIYLKFYRADVTDRKIIEKKDPTILVIHLVTSLSTNVTGPLLRKIHGVWTKEAKEFYGEQKIKDIEIVNYNFK
ncbi:MAG: hypothetical protein EOP45_05305 [Sphingobacteriaceae bacterium]|nr:MAG: hypothetical protein EOP45_05305 [Sphingobacteriaceae bacterium]